MVHSQVSHGLSSCRNSKSSFSEEEGTLLPQESPVVITPAGVLGCVAPGLVEKLVMLVV